MVVESEDWRSEENGIKEISLGQYKRCTLEGSKNILYNSEQREIFFNSVDQMEIILMPEIEDHEDSKNSMKALQEKFVRVENEFIEKANDIQKNAPKGKQINMDLLSETYERKLIKLYREKLVILSRLLKYLNYYEERTSNIWS